MGQEIDGGAFSARDFDDFASRLTRETALLARWFEENRFSTRTPVGGFELEAWLVDANSCPAPINEDYLARLQDPMVVPELARFNVELNVHPEPLTGPALGRMYQALETTWTHCARCAEAMGAGLMMTGILPTLRAEQLTAANMSNLNRYRALNEQVLRQRQGRPLQLEIHGREHLRLEQQDVMLESATTSFQLHLKVKLSEAVRHYNAALILSAPLVGVSANSPYLFGRDLWAETRIPLFEQSVAVGGFDGAAQGPIRRVSFGTGYVRQSLLECFTENRDHFPVLLPALLDEAPERLPHLRMHNGTIWRWNRPLIGFDDDGTPHLRIEYRVAPAGPTAADAIANAAFCFGLAHSLATAEQAPEQKLDFARVRDNFYAAAREGLEAPVNWLDGRRYPLRDLILEQLLPLAHAGLDGLEIDAADRDTWLGIIEARTRSGRNGTQWQRDFVARHGADMQHLAAAYRQRQESGVPVHEWDS